MFVSAVCAALLATASGVGAGSSNHVAASTKRAARAQLDPVALSLIEEEAYARGTRALLQNLKVEVQGQALSLKPQNGMNDVQVFEAFDTDHSGHVEKKEFMAALHALGYEVDGDTGLRYFKECDKNGDNSIDLDEIKDLLPGGGKSGGGGDGSDGDGGGYDNGKCLAAIDKVKGEFLVNPTKKWGDLPRHLQEWCEGLAPPSSNDGSPESAQVITAWKSACKAARRALEAAHQKGKSGLNAFCEAMNNALTEHADNAAKIGDDVWIFDTEHTNTAPYAPPVATASCDLQYLKRPRPCCKKHGYKGCHDKHIEECVCQEDPSCCKVAWDIKCSELVEKVRIRDGHRVLRCGRCKAPNPDPFAAAKALADCLEDNCA